MRRCDTLGTVSEERGRLTRTFASPAMRRANQRVGDWMRAAGLQVREDDAFNLLGRWNSDRRGAKTLLVGSHLDTVRDAGKYDGPLGVLSAIAAVQWLRVQGVRLPFHLEVVGFSDEEGVRYQTTYLGSRALAGTLTRSDLARIREKQIVKARRRAGEFLGYVEVHIEQGPVLEEHDLPVGIVSAIAGQSRIQVVFQGTAGHAGTVPMNRRHDALAGAAELVLAAEHSGVLSTVGRLDLSPGVSNVIPGRAALTLDVRHAHDVRRRAAVRSLHGTAKTIAKRRGLRLTWTPVQETDTVLCDGALKRLLRACVARRGIRTLQLPSGAGHDAAAISTLCPVGMLFVRCRGGLSHHPAESVKTNDVAIAIGVLADFIQSLAARHA
jgi:allantoate deiminase